MLSAIGLISSGSEPGTPLTHSTISVRVIVQASARVMPLSLGALAASESLVPPQSGHLSSFRNLSTLFIPFSSLTFASAFSTVYVALKKVKSNSAASLEFLAL
ncbi:unknown [Bacteroides sp. CAG:1060]|nr:unknown [Bacteroides sp. CAG:1060]